MRVSIAICTWNRAELLRRTLDEMTRLITPHGVDWELLIVNNNCTDETDEVIAGYSRRLPLRRLFEPEPGQSHARNTAVREAAGDYILWTDDDVLVDPRWLAAYQDAFRRWPDAAIFGGPIEPWFEGSPPAWLRAAFPVVAGAYAALDLGAESVPLDHERYPFGANMAFRTDALRRWRYDPALGLRPGGNVRGDEMVLIRTMIAAGETGWWVPDARVRHFIPRDRQSIAYLRRYYYGGGKLLARLDSEPPVGRTLFGRPLWLWRQAVVAEVRYRALRFFARPETWLQAATLASLSWGQLTRRAPTAARAEQRARLP